MRDALGQHLGDLVVPGIPANHLQVDGSGQAEVQDLIGNVGGLEEESRVREFLAQTIAQFDGVIRGGAVVVGLEGNQNIAVAGSQRADIAEGQIETAERDANIIDDGVDFVRWDGVPDFLVDLGKQDFGLFDARAGGRHGVQAHLAGIDGGEEIAPGEDDQEKRGGYEDAEARQDRRAVVEGPMQQPGVE